MNILKKFNEFCLFEEMLQTTSSWFVSTDGSSFNKSVGSGYLYLHDLGSLAVSYKCDDDKEVRMDFPKNGEEKPCTVSLIDDSGKTIEEKSFEDVNMESVLEIIFYFFDLCNPESMKDYEIDKLIMGLSKTLVSFSRSDYLDQSPVSFKGFLKTIESTSESEIPKKKDLPESYKDPYEVVKKFYRSLLAHLLRRDD